MDVAVAGSAVLDRGLIVEVQGELSALLDRPVDLVDLGTVEGLILREIIIGGGRVKTDAELFVRFHTKVLSYREDFLSLRRAMQDARIERFIDGSRHGRDQA